MSGQGFGEKPKPVEQILAGLTVEHRGIYMQAVSQVYAAKSEGEVRRVMDALNMLPKPVQAAVAETMLWGFSERETREKAEAKKKQGLTLSLQPFGHGRRFLVHRLLTRQCHSQAMSLPDRLRKLFDLTSTIRPTADTKYFVFLSFSRLGLPVS